MSFFAELKRRNVFRVGIAYVVVTWLVLQVADVMIDNIGAPEWLFKFIVLMLGIGFPVALLFAWAFEMTPQGLKRESEVDRSHSITPHTGRKLDYIIIGVLVVALGYFVSDRIKPGPESPGPQATAQDRAAAGDMTLAPEVAADPSIAVLPFVNMSNDPEQEFFSDGISEELLNLLVRVDGLQVASRTSSVTYQGANRNLPQIASELQVDHELEGSVRKADNRVRITAQLIDTRTDRHLWSQTFDRELNDIFAIQDEIANAIVTALQQELGVGLQSVTVAAATENLDAYQLYLKARELFQVRQNLPTAISLFEQATILDPGYAKAWEGLAAAQSVGASWLVGDGIDHRALAAAAADRALELDPSLSMPYAVKGIDWDSSKGELSVGVAHLDRAIHNDDKNATAWLWRGILLKDAGYLEESAADFRQCLQIDAAYTNCKQHLAEALRLSGHETEAVGLFEETLEKNFFSTGDAFVSYYTWAGDRATALLLASAQLKRPYAPVKDWIDALEHPEQDHADRVGRWGEWAAGNNLDICDLEAVVVALQQWHCFAGPTFNGRSLWLPEAARFRKTEAFKDYVRMEWLAYWRERGFPAQCRALGEEDFECD
jgi:TolB-like protein